MVQSFLESLSDNEEVYRVELEIESTEPFEQVQPLFVSSGATESGDEEESESEAGELPHPEEDTEEASESEVEKASVSEASDEMEDEGTTEAADTETDEYELTLGTRKYRVASVLLHADEPKTAGDLEQVLSGTDWESEKGDLSTVLGKLFQDNIVGRKSRENSGPGKNPFEYWLNDEGAEVAKSAEFKAEANDAPTFETVAEGIETADTVQVDVEEPNREVEVEALTPGTQKYNAVIALLALDDGNAIPRELEEMLEGTELASDRSNLSSALGELHESGVVVREKDTDVHGNPYRYQLTEDGRELAQVSVYELDEGEVDDAVVSSTKAVVSGD